MQADEVLTTTRAVRRRLDFSRPVPRELVEECLEIALQAPNASNRQSWRFVLVDDPDKKEQIAHWYSRAFRERMKGKSPAERTSAVNASAAYLAEHLHEVPVLVVACMNGTVAGGDSTVQQAGFWASIYPAVWSLMLAARGRGLGTALTTVHLTYEREVADILAIPHGEATQAALIPIAYVRGAKFGPAARDPLVTVAAWNQWPRS